jgi:3-oxoacyl-[acyl-carrier protein] reductase
MDLGLKNKVAFVAGASRGIGNAIASAFLREGSRTVITGRTPEKLEQARTTLAKQWGEDYVLAIAGDLTAPDTIKNAFRETIARWGNIDCVVANIGSGKSTPGWDLSDKDWSMALEQNFWPGIRIAQQALRLMIPAGSGSIVFIASITALEATSAPLPYSAAKAALVNYTGNLARVVAPHHIRVNCVAPGNILFPGGSWESRLQIQQAQVLDYIRAEVPQNRFGTVEEIADIVVFLSSDRASFVTGACWTADGGQTRAF